MSLLQMSVAGAVMILVITVIRALAINRLPKKTFLILWGITIIRLLIPFSFPSGFSIYSLLGRKTGSDINDTPAVRFMPINTQTPVTTQAPQSQIPAFTISAWDIIWVAGLVLCTVFFISAYIRCYREFRTSLPVENAFTRRWLETHNLKRRLSIRQSDLILAPLTFGVWHPVILMPKKTDWENEDTLRYVLEHEFIHIRRFDTFTKFLLITTVCIHWFNPLVWVMYLLANRDIELSCDEAVIHHFGGTSRASYAKALISMEETKGGFMPLCNYFSRNAIEERITAIMKTKKTTIISFAVAMVLVTGTVTVFATSAKGDESSTVTEATDTTNTTFSDTVDTETIMSYINPDDGKTYYSFDNGKTFEALTDAEFDAKFPTPDIEWWTYDEYKAWLENEKAELKSIIGSSYISGGKKYVWTQDRVNETIAMYEGILEDIKNGAKYSKSVDGQDDEMVSYTPADIAQTKESLSSIERSMTDCQDEVSASVAKTNESLKSIERAMTDCQDEASKAQANESLKSIERTMTEYQDEVSASQATSN